LLRVRSVRRERLQCRQWMFHNRNVRLCELRNHVFSSADAK
jgi:hypothetical protein